MFTWLNKQGVKSSKGFSLQSVDRYRYEYTEAEKILHVEVEPLRSLSGDYFEEIFSRSLSRWLPPHDAERISPEQVELIRQNISDALTFMRIKHRFK
jgi:hypothetical protein